MRKIKVLVCGAGSIGTRHISNLLNLGVDVSVWRKQKDLLDKITHDYPVHPCNELEKGIIAANAVVISTATDNHMSIATEALQAGRALFIEKPISNSWSGVENLLEIGKDITVEIGCQLRAHPVLNTLAEILTKKNGDLPLTYRMVMGHRLDAWRPDQDYRQSYSAHSDRGGGALFDLIHQIDLALWFFGPVTSVTSVLSSISDLEIVGDDVANILMTHKCGVTGHIQLDMCSPVYRCEIEVVATESVYKWSNVDGTLLSFSVAGKNIIQELPSGFERNDLFITHMEHFLKRLDESVLPPLCSLESGVDALKVALAARESNIKKISINL